MCCTNHCRLISALRAGFCWPRLDEKVASSYARLNLHLHLLWSVNPVRKKIPVAEFDLFRNIRIDINLCSIGTEARWWYNVWQEKLRHYLLFGGSSILAHVLKQSNGSSGHPIQETIPIKSPPTNIKMKMDSTT